ncbi:type I secretion protein TolC [Billgrantia azerbaijanica]|nr:type I secretion protein TolC [Halomonas azerbaijanica]
MARRNTPGGLNWQRCALLRAINRPPTAVVANDSGLVVGGRLRRAKGAAGSPSLWQRCALLRELKLPPTISITEAGNVGGRLCRAKGAAGSPSLWQRCALLRELKLPPTISITEAGNVGGRLRRAKAPSGAQRLALTVPAVLAALLALAPVAAVAQQEDDVPAGEQAVAELVALDDYGAGKASDLPSLPGLFQRALEHDAELARQRYLLEATEQESDLAFSQLLPQVSATGGYLYQDSTNIQTSPDDFGLDQPAQRPGEIDEHYWQLSLQQPLFSLERWRGLDRADAQIGAAELDLALAERDLALAVSEAYVNAFLASRKLGLLGAQQESLELQVRQARRAFELGVGDRLNLLEAQSRLDQAIADTVQAENELDDARSELERLTGVLPDFDGRQLGDLSAVSLETKWDGEQQWLDRTGNSLDVQRAEAEREIADSDTRVRRSGYFPELNLNLSYSDRVSDDVLRESEDYRAVVELNMPIYRGGYTMANVRQGELRTRASQQAVDHQRSLAAQEVRTRLRSLSGSVRRMAALEQAIASSELFLEAAERGEQLGLRDLVDVLDARASLYDQRIQYVDTLGSYVLDRLMLQTAVGELDSEDLAQSMALLSRIAGAAP